MEINYKYHIKVYDFEGKPFESLKMFYSLKAANAYVDECKTKYKRGGIKITLSEFKLNKIGGVYYDASEIIRREKIPARSMVKKYEDKSERLDSSVGQDARRCASAIQV